MAPALSYNLTKGFQSIGQTVAMEMCIFHSHIHKSTYNPTKVNSNIHKAPKEENFPLSVTIQKQI